jgi:hypothetical protein
MLAGAGGMVWAFRRWRAAVQLALLLVILEGAIRKWVFPSAQDLVYFAKDIVLLGVYLGFFRERARLRIRPPALPALYAVLIASVLLGLLEIFNPNLPSLLVGVFGFKAYFYYVPLLFVVPAAFADDAALYQFLRRYALLAVPTGLLAVAQFFSPASSALNTYARGSEDVPYVATFGSSSYVRVTSTFSFITGYTSYLVATAILILAILGAVRWRFRGHLWMLGALGMTFLGMLMSGSRAPVATILLLFPLYWWLAVIRERGGGGAFGRLLIALALVGVAMSFTTTGKQAIDAFLGRARGGEDVPSRVTSPLLSPYLLLADVGLAGYGIGATHQTAVALTPGLIPYSWLHGLNTEVETGRVMLELGPLGFVLVYFGRVYLAIFAFRRALALRTRFHRAVAIASFLFFLTAILGGAVFDVTADFFYWFFAGLLMLALRLDRESARKAARAAAALRPETLPEAAPLPVAR